MLTTETSPENSLLLLLLGVLAASRIKIFFNTVVIIRRPGRWRIFVFYLRLENRKKIYEWVPELPLLRDNEIRTNLIVRESRLL